MKGRSEACLKSGRELPLRGAASDEAIAFSGKDCFTSFAMTRYLNFSDSLSERFFAPLQNDNNEGSRWKVYESSMVRFMK